MRFSYVWREITLRRRRHLTAILGLAVGIALLVILQALAGAYRQAARAPLAEIGADITIQRSGDVPRDLQGAVFPCSAVTIRQHEVELIDRDRDRVQGARERGIKQAVADISGERWRTVEELARNPALARAALILTGIVETGILVARTGAIKRTINGIVFDGRFDAVSQSTSEADQDAPGRSQSRGTLH